MKETQKPGDRISTDIQVEPAVGTYYQYERPELLDLIPTDAKRVLDIGCAAGWLGAEIKRRQQCRVYGIEPNVTAAQEAARKIDKVWNVKVEEWVDMLEPSFFDCIVLADVLEHLIDPWSVLKKLGEKLEVGGKIVASIPNICNWMVVEALVKGRWTYESEGLLDRTHLRFFTLASIRELFWNAHLRLVALKTTTRDSALRDNAAASIKNTLSKIELPAESIKERGTVWQYLVVGEKPPLVEDSPSVSIVIVNWNNKDNTLECLRSAKQIDYENYEVVVVDNGSTDDSVAAIRRSFPDVTVIETKKNLGYAGGNNVGLRHVLKTGSKWVLLLNNDTVVDPMVLKRFVQAGELIPDAGVLGAKVYFYSDPNRIWHAGGICCDDSGEFRALGTGWLDTGQDFNIIREVDCVYGCAFFLRSDSVRRVGLFEEKFFLTHADVDWCRRAKRSGLECIFVPDAHVWHKVSASPGGEQSPVHHYFTMRSRLVWAKKNLGPVHRWHLWARIAGELSHEYFDSLYLMRWSKSSDYAHSKQLYWLTRHWLNELREKYCRPEFRAKVYGLRDYLLGRFGSEEKTVRSLK
jgi:GT2 family glycosyltransferase/2-polyprenyl-3-methyl-5-hydroxy-6-metoxy-1,4-benzoquinol methylase